MNAETLLDALAMGFIVIVIVILACCLATIFGVTLAMLNAIADMHREKRDG